MFIVEGIQWRKSAVRRSTVVGSKRRMARGGHYRHLYGWTGQQLASTDEADIYAKLGLPWIPPVLREDRGEVEAALEGHLPAPTRLPAGVGRADVAQGAMSIALLRISAATAGPDKALNLAGNFKVSRAGRRLALRM